MRSLSKAGCILIIVFSLLFTSCKKNDDKPDFSSFNEELEYLTGKYVKVGAAIGIIDLDQQEQKYFYGTLSTSRDIPPNEHSVFEIGSVTKSFTAALLADMILDEKINLDDEIRDLLPQGEVTVPSMNNTSISIKHLATHSSGLPKSPQGSGQPLPPLYDPFDPYAAYTTNYVYDYLSNYCDLLFEPGTRYSYSNTGFGLLGHILGLLDNSSYEELVTKKIFEPLGMEETSLFLNDTQLANLAPGHDEKLDSVKNYNAYDIFQGAGFIKSSLHDMMIYLKVQMGLLDSPLSDAIEMTHQEYFNVGIVTYNDREGVYDLSIGLAWHIDILPEGYRFYWHGGRTNGYMAYLAFDPATQTGVVILCNQSSIDKIIRFGEDLLKAVNKYPGK